MQQKTAMIEKWHVYTNVSLYIHIYYIDTVIIYMIILRDTIQYACHNRININNAPVCTRE